MGIEDINQAAGAMNALTARINSFMSDADAEIAQRQAVYDNLVNDLGNEVDRRMTYAATIDPNIANPTRRDGGTFNTIGDAVDKAPGGALVLIYLMVGPQHVMNRNVGIGNKDIVITRNGNVGKAQVSFLAYSDPSYNAFYNFNGTDGGSIRFAHCAIDLPIDKPNENLPWNGSSAVIVRYNIARVAQVSFYETDITGSNDHALVTGNGASLNLLSLYACQLDGQILGCRNLIAGVNIISKQVVTLSNGAKLYPDDEPTTALLMN